MNIHLLMAVTSAVLNFPEITAVHSDWKKTLWNEGIKKLSEETNPYQTLVSIVNIIENEEEALSLEPYINDIFTRVLILSSTKASTQSPPLTTLATIIKEKETTTSETSRVEKSIPSPTMTSTQRPGLATLATMMNEKVSTTSEAPKLEKTISTSTISSHSPVLTSIITEKGITTSETPKAEKTSISSARISTEGTGSTTPSSESGATTSETPRVDKTISLSTKVSTQGPALASLLNRKWKTTSETPKVESTTNNTIDKVEISRNLFDEQNNTVKEADSSESIFQSPPAESDQTHEPTETSVPSTINNENNNTSVSEDSTTSKEIHENSNNSYKMHMLGDKLNATVSALTSKLIAGMNIQNATEYNNQKNTTAKLLSNIADGKEIINNGSYSKELLSKIKNVTTSILPKINMHGSSSANFWKHVINFEIDEGATKPLTDLSESPLEDKTEIASRVYRSGMKNYLDFEMLHTDSRMKMPDVTNKFKKTSDGDYDNSRSKDSKPQKYIIDTDCTADDAMAVLSFLGAEQAGKNIKLEALTVVAGKTSIKNAAENIYRVLNVANRLDIPTYEGQDTGLISKPRYDFHFGPNGFGDFNSTREMKHTSQNISAAEALVSIVRKTPGVITLICLGPLTNVAIASRFYPSFLADLREIFILGGSKSGLPTTREYNFKSDPEAAQIVLTDIQNWRNISATILPFEPADMIALPMSQRNKLRNQTSTSMNLINQAESLPATVHFWTPYPTILTAVALSFLPSTSKNYSVSVELGEVDRGALKLNKLQTNQTIKVIESLSNNDLLKYLENTLIKWPNKYNKVR